ncbi:MAG: hypothetical protein KBC00_00390 [Candidatus Levybacteria bacterium]|nr:hypothetical protein [Candidatus Levybacteria bacterium]MBP9815167.1 hypothetical protein [Candidatus Levybacteria bacterium]
MKHSFLKKFFYWTPRIFSIGFVLFISVFALDVFSEYSGREIILPLFMHLLPPLILLITVTIAWKYELVGAVIFLVFSMLYVLDVGLSRPLSWYLVIVLPSLVVGIFYFLSWIQRREF